MTIENASTLSEDDILASTEGSVVAKLNTDPAQRRDQNNLGSTTQWERVFRSGDQIILNGTKITLPPKSDFLEFFCKQLRSKSPPLSDEVLRCFIRGGAQGGFGWNGFNYIGEIAQHELGIALKLTGETRYEITVDGNKILLTITQKNIRVFHDLDFDVTAERHLSDDTSIAVKTSFLIEEKNGAVKFRCLSHQDNLLNHAYEIYKTRTAYIAALPITSSHKKKILAYLKTLSAFLKKTPQLIDTEFKQNIQLLLNTIDDKSLKEHFTHTFEHQDRTINALHACEQELAKSYALFFAPDGKLRPEKLNLSEKEISETTPIYDTNPVRLTIYEYVNKLEHDTASSQLHRIQTLLASNPFLNTKADLRKISLLSTVLKPNNIETENQILLDDFSDNKINFNVFISCLDKTAANVKKIKTAGLALATLNSELHNDLVKLSSLPHHNPYSAKKYIKSMAKPGIIKTLLRKLLGWTEWSRAGKQLTIEAKKIRRLARAPQPKSSSLAKLVRLFNRNTPTPGQPNRLQETARAIVARVAKKFSRKKTNIATPIETPPSAGKKATH